MSLMRPEEIALALMRRWWLITLAAVAAALVAYIGTSSQAKTYTVSTRIMAVAEPPDYWLDLYAKNRLASYKDLISNWEFISESLREAGSDIDPGLASSTLALAHNPDANIVQLVVTDTDPARAAEIANALADGFILQNQEQNDELLARDRAEDEGVPGRVEMLKLDAPSAPSTPSGPRVRVNTLAGGVLGVVAGLMVAFLLLYLDDTLKGTRDLDRYLALPLLARIPDSAGARERPLPRRGQAT